jgi:hypothetical protein
MKEPRKTDREHGTRDRVITNETPSGRACECRVSPGRECRVARRGLRAIAYQTRRAGSPFGPASLGWRDAGRGPGLCTRHAPVGVEFSTGRRILAVASNRAYRRVLATRKPLLLLRLSGWLLLR